MHESPFLQQFVDEGRRDGELRAMRRAVLGVISLRLADPVPLDVRLAVEGANDLATLDRWHGFAVTSPTLDAFRLQVSAKNDSTGSGRRESQFLKQFVDEGRRQGELRAGRWTVLNAISLRLAKRVPEQVHLAVEVTRDPEVLRRWHQLAVTCPTLDEFLSQVSAKNGSAASS
jgi:hypothetical protein